MIAKVMTSLSIPISSTSTPTQPPRRENNYNEDTEIAFNKDDEPEMYKALGIRRLRDRKDYSKYDRWDKCRTPAVTLFIFFPPTH